MSVSEWIPWPIDDQSFRSQPPVDRGMLARNKPLLSKLFIDVSAETPLSITATVTLATIFDICKEVSPSILLILFDSVAQW